MEPNVRVSEGDKGIIERVKSVTKRLRAPVKDYFLAQMGFSAHDLHVFTAREALFSVEKFTLDDPLYSLAPYPWIRKLLPEPLHILNASKTSPAILECHLMIDWSRQSGEFEKLGDPTSPSPWNPGFIWSRSYLPAEPEKDQCEHRLPVLEKGIVLTVYMTSARYVYYREVEEWADSNSGRRNDLVVPDVPKQIAERAQTALAHCTEHANIELLVRLDNEELLPFEWDPSTARFIPGFDTIGIEHGG